jgi:glutathione S-transferase
VLDRAAGKAAHRDVKLWDSAVILEYLTATNPNAEPGRRHIPFTHASPDEVAWAAQKTIYAGPSFAERSTKNPQG